MLRSLALVSLVLALTIVGCSDANYGGSGTGDPADGEPDGPEGRPGDDDPSRPGDGNGPDGQEPDGEPTEPDVDGDCHDACICADTAGLVCDDGAECLCDTTVHRAEFDEFNDLMVGEWTGVASNLWEGEYGVDVTFRADGTYSAQCHPDAGSDCSPFYWGVDGDSPDKTWWLSDILASGRGMGNLTFLHGSGSTTRGNLDRIALTHGGDSLFFEVWPQDRDVAGPVVVHLVRR